MRTTLKLLWSHVQQLAQSYREHQARSVAIDPGTCTHNSAVVISTESIPTNTVHVFLLKIQKPNNNLLFISPEYAYLSYVAKCKTPCRKILAKASLTSMSHSDSATQSPDASFRILYFYYFLPPPFQALALPHLWNGCLVHHGG